MKVIVIMFKKSVYRNYQQQPILLNKNQSSYRQVERAMKEGVKEYEQIKKLVDAQQSLASIRDNTDENIIKNNAIKLTPHQTKKNINIKSKK